MTRLFGNTGFTIHLIVYAAVNFLLIAINLLTSPKELWFVWPLAGWGLGIIGHAAAVIYSGRRARRELGQALGVKV
jgi:hypothetical protein